MIRKVLDIISVLAFILAASLSGGTLFAYFWLTNSSNQEMLKEKALDAVKGALPIPGNLTGPALPTGKSGKGATGVPKIPSF